MEREFAHFIKTDELLYKHAKGMRDVYGKEFHTFHEIFLFLGGDAQFTSDSMQEKLSPGALILIPRGCFHQFTSDNDVDYRRCVFNFGSVRELDELIDEKMREVSILMLPDGLTEQFERLFSAAKEAPDSSESKIMAKAVLALILCSIKNDGICEKAVSVHPIINQAVKYIDSHISEPLKIEDIAKHLHISPSYLMKLFKSKMHISVYKYITEKRLVFAATQIRGGVAATKAAEISGFPEYSSFYRLYKSRFGISPSETISIWGEGY